MNGLRHPRHIAAAVLLGAACWLVGFGWFMWDALRPPPPPPAHVDGIVALTGGAGRVERALQLLRTGQADKLLVTGIGGGTDLATLGRLAGIDTGPLAARVTLGRYAASTRGNGVEAAAWVARNRVASLIVVTASYHMPRALAELRFALPGVRLYPLPVQPQAASGAGERGPGLRLAVAEYAKYLFTVSGLSNWLPRREGSASMPTPSESEE